MKFVVPLFPLLLSSSVIGSPLCLFRERSRAFKFRSRAFKFILILQLFIWPSLEPSKFLYQKHESGDDCIEQDLFSSGIVAAHFLGQVSGQLVSLLASFNSLK